MGKVCQLRGLYRSAIEAYTYVEEQDPCLMPEVTDEIRNCYERLGHRKSWQDYLDGLVERHANLEFLQNHQPQPQLQKVAPRRSRYCCEYCGFSSRKLFWQCPACQSWGSVKPIVHPCRASDSPLRETL